MARGDVNVPCCVKSRQKQKDEMKGVRLVFFTAVVFSFVLQTFQDSKTRKGMFFSQSPSKGKNAGRKPLSNGVVENHWVAQPQPVLILYTSVG